MSFSPSFEQMLRLRRFSICFPIDYQMLNGHYSRVFLKTLKPCQELTIKLQKEDIKISDAYLFWRERVLELQNIGSALASKMIEKMDYRKTTLFSHPAFIGCLYLDPRTKGVLNNEERFVCSLHIEPIKKFIENTAGRVRVQERAFERKG